MAKPIPDGYHSITPAFVIKGAAEAIDFYTRAFGAKTRGVMKMPDGRVMHAEIQIGDSIIMLSDELGGQVKAPPTLGGTSMALMIYTHDVDALYAQAMQAGCKAIMPPADMFWGDRYGQVVDPYGHIWDLATHKQDLTEEQVARGAEQMMKQMQPKK